MKKLFIFLICFSAKNLTTAQNFEVGLLGGFTSYNGDVQIPPKNKSVH